MTQRLVGPPPPPPPPPLSEGLIKPFGRQRPVTPSPGVLPVITPQFPTGCRRDPSPDLRGKAKSQTPPNCIVGNDVEEKKMGLKSGVSYD